MKRLEILKHFGKYLPKHIHREIPCIGVTRDERKTRLSDEIQIKPRGASPSQRGPGYIP